ncbi:MAG: hypothetical protein V4505_04650 [Pseudomonadota bacterium]
MDTTSCPNDDLAALRRKAADYQRWLAAGYISEETVRWLLQADAKDMDRAMDCCVVIRSAD